MLFWIRRKKIAFKEKNKSSGLVVTNRDLPVYYI